MILKSYLGIEYSGERKPQNFSNFVRGVNHLNLGIPAQQDDSDYLDGYQAALDIRVFIKITENGKTSFALEETPGNRYPNKFMAIKASRFPSVELDETEVFIYQRPVSFFGVSPFVMVSATNGDKWHIAHEGALRQKYQPLPEGYVYAELDREIIMREALERARESRLNMQSIARKPKSNLKSLRRGSIL